VWVVSTTFLLPTELTLDVIDHLGDLADQASQAAEILAEISNEVSLYGDSGPGTADQAISARRFLSDVDAFIAAVHTAFPVAGPPAPIVDEEPF
jgi:hypothetical protein